MMQLTRLDGSELTVNCELVETVERTPDTVISLLTGHKLVVRESVDEIVERVVEYRQRIHQCPLMRDHVLSPTVGKCLDHETDA